MHDSTRIPSTAKARSSAPGSIPSPMPQRILALDLGKFKSVACDYDPATGTHAFTTIPTRPDAVHDLLAERLGGDCEATGEGGIRLVIEVGSAAGWVKDLAEALGIDVQVANPNHEAWRWKSIKRKTDKDDDVRIAEG